MPKILLIASRRADRWARVLEEALAGVGSLELATEIRARNEIGRQDYSVVIIDSSSVAEPLELTRDLLKANNRLRVVVATLSPTWKRAREAMQAGAMDYMPKTMVREELRRQIQQVMQIPTPPARP